MLKASSKIRTLFLFGILPGILFTLSYCTRSTSTVSQDPSELSKSPDGTYWAQSDTVSYVGMNVCAQCHSGQHATYVHTGMGRSFDLATKNKSAANFEGHPEIYDKDMDLTYRPGWDGDTLRIEEFRVTKGDTVHHRTESIAYIIGSGQHTNSHLIDRKGYVYQAPITFYTQKGKWDLAPGFENGFNSRFSRMIETECMTCHNGLPDQALGAINKYKHVPLGIDCERCHGPGAEHVRQKSLGKVVDTTNQIDYTIVNPVHLPIASQLDLCQRCHLQGVAVLNDGASWFDFQPGDRIKEHWNIFLPQFSEGNGNFLMASQAERLRKSNCFNSTVDGISCLECHNPHLTVDQTPVSFFNKSCNNCHSDGTDCKEAPSVRATQEDNCSACHMPQAGSIDIPHVSITDHKIQVPGRLSESKDVFEGLQCMTDKNVSALEHARGYLKFYEAFNANEAMLDSAALLLANSKAESELKTRTAIHLNFLRENFDQVCKLSKAVSSSSEDPWACYRIGESWNSIGDPLSALAWLKRAAELMPYQLDFRLKYANTLSANGKTDAAIEEYQWILTEQPDRVVAASNLGFLLLQKGNAETAEFWFTKAMQSDPDYLPVRINMIQYWWISGKQDKARNLLDQLLDKNPRNADLLTLKSRIAG